MAVTGPGPNSHAVLTGPIQGLVTLADGTVVNATPDVVYFDSLDQAHDAADKIAKHYKANGHPDDIDIEDGVPVQREFVYDEKTSKENLANPAALTAPPKKG